jgi:hypothetical protein
VREGEGADGGVVCLEDGLEVEGEPVPEGELPACGTGEDTSAFGCPLCVFVVNLSWVGGEQEGTYYDDVDGASDLVRRRVHEFCT